MSKKNNIPIYRAKKIDSDEWVEGSCVYPYKDNSYFIIVYGECEDGEMHDAHFEIDQNTIAIHFPNMIDKNGKKIFASLSEDGVGGDIVSFRLMENNIWKDHEGICIFNEEGLQIIYKYGRRDMIPTLEVIGIHKGE